MGEKIMDVRKIELKLDSKIGKAIYVGCVTLFLTALGSWAVVAHQEATTVPAKTTTTGRPSMVDSHFAKEAAQGGLAEVKLGQLAQEKGTSDAVKNFGKRMVEDHTKAGNELKDAASKENIKVPSEIAPKDQALYDRLSKLSGATFDRAYAKDMVKDHQMDIAAFEREANAGKNDGLKSFASATLPTLKEHLAQAKEMLTNVSGGARAKRVKGTSGSGK
ncbi:MAG: hypothetical protein NVS9B4_27260 [Candidatus Acidiferrum sp.]